MYVLQHCFICRPSDSTVSEDVGIEPRTVTTLALTARRSNHSARSHPFRFNLENYTLETVLNNISLIILGRHFSDFFSIWSTFNRLSRVFYESSRKCCQVFGLENRRKRSLLLLTTFPYRSACLFILWLTHTHYGGKGEKG
jgi:hypothetical protein